VGQHFQHAVLLDTEQVSSNLILFVMGNVFGKAGNGLALAAFKNTVSRQVNPFLPFG
jgi:hypothetical protein